MIDSDSYAVLYDSKTGQPFGSMMPADPELLAANIRPGHDWLVMPHRPPDLGTFYVDIKTKRLIDIPTAPDLHYTWNWKHHAWRIDTDAAAAAIRGQRDQLLAESDWTQGSDLPDHIRVPWANYRNALRDITKQATFPTSVIWPQKP